MRHNILTTIFSLGALFPYVLNIQKEQVYC